MFSLPTLDLKSPSRRLPSWLKRPLPAGNENFFTHNLLRELRLETVCENARCPNRPECYARRTATFMVLGNVCTRPCGFCAVPRGAPEDLEADEHPDRQTPNEPRPDRRQRDGDADDAHRKYEKRKRRGRGVESGTAG